MRLGVLMEIIEGIHRVDEASSNIAHSNVYLVIDGKELVVVDTGSVKLSVKLLHVNFRLKITR